MMTIKGCGSKCGFSGRYVIVCCGTNSIHRLHRYFLTVYRSPFMFFRALQFILGGCAIACSIVCIYSCQFFAYRTLDGQPWEALSPPFDTLNKAAVGLFAYSDATNDENVVFGDSCLKYPEWSEVGQSKLFLVAQWCAMFAAVSGFLGWTVATVDVCFFDSVATTVMSAFFFFAATALQLSTLLVFGDTEFW
jgi:hypothetical protein